MSARLERSVRLSIKFDFGSDFHENSPASVGLQIRYPGNFRLGGLGGSNPFLISHPPSGIFTFGIPSPASRQSANHFRNFSRLCSGSLIVWRICFAIFHQRDQKCSYFQLNSIFLIPKAFRASQKEVSYERTLFLDTHFGGAIQAIWRSHPKP